MLRREAEGSKPVIHCIAATSLALSVVFSSEAWLVSSFVHCALQPPFNEAARVAAGFGPNWYLPLSEEVLK